MPAIQAAIARADTSPKRLQPRSSQDFGANVGQPNPVRLKDRRQMGAHDMLPQLLPSQRCEGAHGAQKALGLRHGVQGPPSVGWALPHKKRSMHMVARHLGRPQHAAAHNALVDDRTHAGYMPQPMSSSLEMCLMHRKRLDTFERRATLRAIRPKQPTPVLARLTALTASGLVLLHVRKEVGPQPTTIHPREVLA